MADTSTLAIATNIFTSPNQAFAAIKERAPLLLPVLLLILSFSTVNVLYVSRVDMGWLIDQQLQTAGTTQLTAEQREQAVNAATRLPKAVYGVAGAVGTTLAVFLFLLIGALYYTGVSFATGDGVRLKQWFALSCWCTLPSMLGAVAQIVNLLVNDPRFMPSDAINPLSFGNVLSIDRTGVTILQRVLLNIDFTALWGIALSVLGYQAFTKSSIVKSAAVVLGPPVAIVLIWTLLALR